MSVDYYSPTHPCLASNYDALYPFPLSKVPGPVHPALIS